MTGKQWTQAEDAILADFWHATGDVSAHIHRLPGRTRIGVVQRAARLRLGARHIAWSGEEDAILAEIYAGNGSIKSQMHRLPGRTYISAKSRAERLHLDHKAPITDGSLSWIKAAALIELQKGIPLSDATLSRITGATRAGLKPILKRMHGNGIRVAGWERSGAYSWLPQFAIGNEPDVPKPAPKDRLQALREFRERQRIAKGRINPFSAMTGLIAAPTGQPGRVYRQSMSIRDEELEEAA
jgi:hypothetical protein